MHPRPAATLTHRRPRVALAVAVALLACGCGPRVTLPPVTPPPGGPLVPGVFVWHDLLTRDVAAAKGFYGELFGWQFRDAPGEPGLYTVILRDGRPLAGIADVSKSETIKSALWVASIAVADADAAAARVTARGGTVVEGPKDLPDRGRALVATDLEGAPFALLEPSRGGPPDGNPELGEFIWHELVAKKPAENAQFYGAVAGYRLGKVDVGGNDYLLLKAGDRYRAGVSQSPFEDARTLWIPFVRVADAQAATERARTLGARVIVAPRPELRGGSVSLIQDPTGGVLALQRYEPR